MHDQGAAGAEKKMSGCMIAALIAGGVGALLLVGFGVLAVLGVSGMRRFIAASKVAEARANLGSISRAAVLAFESAQEAPGRLCGSATPVPARAPRGTKYMPSAAEGQDYQTGDAKNGWKCLKFSLNSPSFYQYHYNAGSGYLMPAAAPKAAGFEAAAVGDLDGDGVQSLFSMSGQIEGLTLKIAPSITTRDENE
ncbi:MAG: hypothetical protein MUF64_01110 [Polyangiaceae bacterium]|jgi:type IV pilus assembly protein PilA|nr:hypothetical protein [Polyangiaceae bacterium]